MSATSTTSSRSPGSSPTSTQTRAPTTGTDGFLTSYSTGDWATFTIVSDAEHGTTVAVLHDGTTVVLGSTPLPSSTRTPIARPTSGSGGSNTPSQLYLLTFAITLSLLLTISMVILFRNLVLRMRERRIREAVAAGLIPPESLAWIYRAQLGLPGLSRWTGNGRTPAAAAAIGPRPVLWDSWIADDGTEKGYNSEKGGGRGAAWADLAPLSMTLIEHDAPGTTTNRTVTPGQTAPHQRRTFVEYVFQLPPMPEIPRVPPSSGATAGTTNVAGAARLDPAEAERQHHEQLIAQLFPAAASTSSSASGAALPGTSAEAALQAQPAPRPAGVRVAVFVAMPRDPRLPAQHRAPGEEEGGLEGHDLIMGTSDVWWESLSPPPMSGRASATPPSR